MLKICLIATMLSILAFSSSCKSYTNGDQLKSEDHQAIIDVMQKVSDWQIENFKYAETGNLHDYGIGAWTNGVLYLGMSEYAKIADKSVSYYTWLKDIGTKSDWKLPANFTNYEPYKLYHADELCMGQFYLAMYYKYGDANMIAATQERLDWIMSNPPSDAMSHKGKQSWTWCDALFMAPPVYIQIAKITGNKSYITYADKEFQKTYAHLFDKEENIFFRDDSFFGKTEANGKKVFWGRGNGWVVAGLANMLKYLPKDSPNKDFYETLFRDMIAKLATLRNTDGFWHASLLDPDSYPAPETSATAMITYAMAWGINNGLLDKEEYLPIVESSWKSLISVVDETGKLGYVQPIGADPKKVTKDMTAVYGVGAFLLAGTEMYKLIN